MFLLLLCLGTILVPSCPASCQPSCSPPPLSGSIEAAWFHPFSRSTTAPTRSCAAAPRSFTIRVRSRDEVVAVSRLKACTDATPGSPCRRGRPPGSRLGGIAATKRVSFSDPLVSSPSSSSALPRTVPELFSYPARRFLHARDQRRLHSLHRCGTRLVNGHRPRGWTSDLFSSQQRPELRGSPVESWLHPY
jgi:hypothetical protein